MKFSQSEHLTNDNTEINITQINDNTEIDLKIRMNWSSWRILAWSMASSGSSTFLHGECIFQESGAFLVAKEVVGEGHGGGGGGTANVE